MSQLSFETNAQVNLEFIHQLTQELTEPLSYIVLSVQMLESIIDDEQQRAFLDVISRSATRIDNFVNTHLQNHQLNNNK